MATNFEIDCALMAGAAYVSNRPDKNAFPAPDDWLETLLPYAINPASGFEAVSFIKGNDVVISFAGTDNKDIFGDWMTDVALGLFGNFDMQLLDAAKYYLEK
jgi:hypothetical protein